MINETAWNILKTGKLKNPLLCKNKENIIEEAKMLIWWLPAFYNYCGELSPWLSFCKPAWSFRWFAKFENLHNSGEYYYYKRFTEWIHTCRVHNLNSWTTWDVINWGSRHFYLKGTVDKISSDLLFRVGQIRFTIQYQFDVCLVKDKWTILFFWLKIIYFQLWFL